MDIAPLRDPRHRQSGPPDVWKLEPWNFASWKPGSCQRCQPAQFLASLGEMSTCSHSATSRWHSVASNTSKVQLNNKQECLLVQQRMKNQAALVKLPKSLNKNTTIFVNKKFEIRDFRQIRLRSQPQNEAKKNLILVTFLIRLPKNLRLGIIH